MSTGFQIVSTLDFKISVLHSFSVLWFFCSSENSFSFLSLLFPCYAFKTWETSLDMIVHTFNSSMQKPSWSVQYAPREQDYIVKNLSKKEKKSFKIILKSLSHPKDSHHCTQKNGLHLLGLFFFLFLFLFSL